MAGRKRPTSSRSTRGFARRILVVTEGKSTERQYVEGLNRYLRSKGATAVTKPVGVGKDPLKVVEECVDIRKRAEAAGKAYDNYVCLVDVDIHTTLQEAIKRAEEEKILLLVSNLKFEVWLRWHVENKTSALNSSQLDKLVAKLGLVEGKEGKTVARCFPFDKVFDACQIARKVDPEMKAGRKGPNPSSALPILVDLMKGDE